MGRKTSVLLLASLIFVSPLFAQTLLERAQQAYISAQEAETVLHNKPAAERTRNEYVSVIKAYERVYLITPRTGYADNALIAIANLYEEINEDDDALRTLRFLVREYPGTPFKTDAQLDIERLSLPAAPVTTEATLAAVSATRGPIAVDNVRYWEAQDSV